MAIARTDEKLNIGSAYHEKPSSLTMFASVIGMAIEIAYSTTPATYRPDDSIRRYKIRVYCPALLDKTLFLETE